MSQYFGWQWGKLVKPREPHASTSSCSSLMSRSPSVSPRSIDQSHGVLDRALRRCPPRRAILVVANDRTYMGDDVNGPVKNGIATFYMVVLTVIALDHPPHDRHQGRLVSTEPSAQAVGCGRCSSCSTVSSWIAMVGWWARSTTSSSVDENDALRVVACSPASARSPITSVGTPAALAAAERRLAAATAAVRVDIATVRDRLGDRARRSAARSSTPAAENDGYET